jgi:hypothetical protein
MTALTMFLVKEYGENMYCKVSDGVTASFVWNYTKYIYPWCACAPPRTDLTFLSHCVLELPSKFILGLTVISFNFLSTPNQSATVLRNKI